MSRMQDELTPTALVAQANTTASQIDKRGRRIVVKRLNALDYYRLTKLMGVASANEATMGMATMAYAVRKIDAQDIAIPTTEREVEFLLQQLDFDGIAAAGEAMAQLNSGDQKAEEEAAKNSVGDPLSS